MLGLEGAFGGGLSGRAIMDVSFTSREIFRGACLDLRYDVLWDMKPRVTLLWTPELETALLWDMKPRVELED